MLQQMTFWHERSLYIESSCIAQNALNTSQSEQQCARLEWQQQEGLLHVQLQQQCDALQQTRQQVTALKAGHDQQQHHMQQQYAEVRASAAHMSKAQQLRPDASLSC